jgi:hypothetical protein
VDVIEPGYPAYPPPCGPIPYPVRRNRKFPSAASLACKAATVSDVGKCGFVRQADGLPRDDSVAKALRACYVRAGQAHLPEIGHGRGRTKREWCLIIYFREAIGPSAAGYSFQSAVAQRPLKSQYFRKWRRRMVPNLGPRMRTSVATSKSQGRIRSKAEFGVHNKSIAPVSPPTMVARTETGEGPLLPLVCLCKPRR